MALTEGDKAIVAEIAAGMTEKMLLMHIQACPWGIKLINMKYLMIGVCLSSFVGGAGVAGFMKLLAGM